MHPNPVFHDAQRAQNVAFAQERGFGALAAVVDGAPLVSHVPFLLNADGTLAELHLVRSNPIARAAKTPVQVRLAVSGPDSYISPDWYGVADQVPTWNYVAVHLTGTLTLCPQDTLHDLLDRQSAVYEERLLPKPPWKTQKMTPEVMHKMMRMIVPCQIEISGVDGTWKLGQNKPDEVRARAAEEAQAHGFGSEAHLLAALMQGAKGAM